MRIAFIQNEAYEKLSVHQLLASLKNNFPDIETEIFIAELEKDIYKAVSDWQPDLLMYSLYIGEESFMLESFAKLKKQLPKVKTVVGGPYTLVFPEIIQDNNVDFLIRGDGEKSLPMLVDYHYRQKQAINPKEIPGVVFQDSDGITFINQNVELISNLEELSLPDRDAYYKYPVLSEKETKYFIASRGCPYNCTYCYNAELKKFYQSPYWRLRKPQTVFREIKYVRDHYGLKWVHFQDGTFNSNLEWLKKFLTEYKKHQLPPFLCNCRVENIDEELIILMKKAGCDRITFGIQTGNEVFRQNTTGRYMSNNQIKKAFNLCHKHNIRVGADVIFGWPGETISNAMDTIDLCRKIKADTCHSNVLIPYPGLQITRKAIEQGYLKETPTLYKIRMLDSNSSLISQNNIKLLINMDKLFFYFINWPRLEGLLKMLLHCSPNPIFKFIKNLHLLKRSLKYESKGLSSSFKIIKSYLKYNL